MQTVVKEINAEKLIRKYFDAMLIGDKDILKQLYHPKVLKYGMGNANELRMTHPLEGLDSLDILVSKFKELNVVFEITQLVHEFIGDVYAIVEVDYLMLWSENGMGRHHSKFQLVYEKDWKIINIMDRGWEVKDEADSITLKEQQLHEEEKEIQSILQMFFDSVHTSDEERFKAVFNPIGRRIAIGNSKDLLIFSQEEVINQTLRGLANAKKSIPGFYLNVAEMKIEHISVYDRIASAEVRWHMVMPEEYGIHHTCFQLVKEGEGWSIIHILDRGIEKQRD
ncbi:MAG: nuclear transport factor 2 family protein [Candidatus Heimdallarchaeota archaeon]|nr:nuclear transport factor 2 family protein [Candidatus Heimdallarchaeota archaeon]